MNLDDILVTGSTNAEHLAALEPSDVWRRWGCVLRKTKCVFLAESVIYLGHVIDAEGLHPIQEKVRAVQDAPDPAPKNATELKSYLGLLSYYSKFLRDLATVLAPLYKLRLGALRKERHFRSQRNLLLSSQVLVHFDPELEIHVACDASDFGIGAVLSHKMPDSTEKPVGFVSRTLNESEKKYSQIEKETAN